MLNKVKIFSGFNEEDLEKRINSWLIKHQNVVITDRTQSASGHRTVISVWY